MKAIEIIMIPVKDQAASKAFYSKLGYQVIIESPDSEGGTWLQMGLPGDSTSISLARFHGIVCETADIQQEVDALKQSGVDCGHIDDTPWGKFAWLKDPDGNGLCLHEKR